MTNQEILTKAIEKALDNKWVGEWNDPGVSNPQVVLDWYEVESMSTNFDNYKLFIYNHDFANALWPGTEGKSIHEAEEVIEDDRGEVHRKDTWEEDYPAWQYHLQQMVVASDPIAYLVEHI